MADNKDKQENNISIPEKNPAPQEAVKIEQGSENIIEKNQALRDEKVVSAELRKEVEMMELDEKMTEEAKKKAEKIEFLGEKEKVEHLLELARKKGLIFAVQVARKMNEQYLLDILHDT